MKFGLFALNYGTCGDPGAAVEIGRYAESAGLESVWTGEHVVMADPRPDRRSFPPTMPFLDTTVALTWLAAHTTKLNLGSGIIVLPLRNPVLLAKELASVDRVSGGRLIAGVAAGYVRAEFTATGVSFAGRHQRTDDYLAALRALWTMEHPRHDGPFVSFSGIDAHPRPVRPSGPPIVAGGESRPALIRAVTMANGWYGFDVDVHGCLNALRDVAAEYDRPRELGPLEITVTPAGPLDRTAVERYEAQGVDRLVLLPQPDIDSAHKHVPVPIDQIKRNIDWIARDLLDR
jgi:probable F420-dependent oxidoreductase